MGPDGALYIADWYNPIIQHGEVDFRDPRRDHIHGRIWRVTAKGHPPIARPKLVGAPVKELLDHLLDPEDWTRQQAKLVMRERGAAEVAPELAKWVKALDKRDPKATPGFDAEHARLEALWTYECIDTVEPKLLERLLTSPDPRARAAAALTVSHWVKQLENPTALLAPLVADDNPRVRLMAVRALVAVGTPDVVPLACKVLDKPMDPFLDYALYKTCTDLEPVWLPAFKSGKLSNWANTAHLTYALKAVQSPEAMAMVVKQLREGQVPPESMRDVFDLIGAVGGPDDVGAMLDVGAKSDKVDAATRAAALKAAERAARQRRVVPAPALDLRPLIESKDPAEAAEAARLAGALKLSPERATLERLASEPATAEPVRMAAVEALAEMGKSPKEAEPLFEKLAAATSAPSVREGGVVGLTFVDVKAAAARAAEWLAGAPAGSDPGPVISAFLRKEGGPDALAAALSGKALSADAAKLSLRYLQGVGQSAPGLTDVLKKQAGVATTSKELSPEQMKQLIAEVAAKGDAARGERVFRSKVTSCYQCHAIGGAGGILAPDLRAIGASAPVDYLINSVLLPNKDIKDGYDSMIVSTRDGDVVQGIKVREDAHELILRDNIRDEIVIPVAQIKGRKDGGSLMPAGLADPLTHQEFVDLVRFLSELGKPGAFAVSDVPVVRRWRVLDPVPETVAGSEPKFPAGDQLLWSSAYSLVSGTLSADALATAAGKPVAFAEAQANVASPGKVRLAFNSLRGLSLWADGQWIELNGAKTSDVVLDLPKGVHTLTFRVDTAKRGGEGLRVEVGDAAGSAAHATPVGGK
jgi:putative heme-binding domain-containing protein